MSYGVVWFKRDLRLHDHAALCAASAQGPLLCLYIIEPQLWQQPDLSSQHYCFLLECLHDLRQSLQQRGMTLLVKVGEACTVLQQLYQASPFRALYAHEETGNHFTYQRDLAVASWCRSHGLPWQEFRQSGVIRRLASRDGWAARWEQLVSAPCLPVPPMQAWPAPLASDTTPSPEQLGIYPFDPPQRQRGGRRRAIAVLQDFLATRSAHYRGGISSPLSAPSACSRLSPYLAMGCLSLREIVQSTRRRLAQLPAENTRQRKGLQAFISRLHWHCHFLQKLESEPAIEWRNLHPGYDGLREEEVDAARLQALMDGRTGWPLVDACVAMLRHTGWLNFRMRAMLVSVAAYPLWLHWRPVGLWLARCFLDYEPGIHWSQLQMQAGTTGINTTRVYNPVKQAMDHDPQGRFVRQWLPAMRRVPDSWLFQPWKMPDDLCRQHGLEGEYALVQPLVELESAARLARQHLHARRNEQAVRAGKQAILHKHGSRKQLARAGGSAKPAATVQLALALDAEPAAD
ncbi:FAD-binding domain-containing protein [Aquitalea aquatica]|uniref:Deoxyribodipyrimidine photo-lyase n=1 Tax=Aquitalea aquatica TaxID=3044273 RepID=A0A838Y879_9NEIS|nr:FAD-binding domain-containing protein [Aquitalea magnusonii]MBA4707235.1 deoxyribodipyrimidine photo-lyase [Aquitalea magnusonii]